MINIANLLLTRRCNLNCDYCRFSGEVDYITKPRDYSTSQYYFDNEKSSEFWIDVIDRLGKSNPNIFFILYGGEPFFYNGLIDVVKYLNNSEFFYTIISNCTLTEKMKIFFNEVKYVKGFTASVDPGFWKENTMNDHELLKSKKGFEFLQYVIKENLTDDPVAEVTSDSLTICDLEETVKRLSDVGITSCINFVDIAKNNYYDFSSITNPVCLVDKDKETEDIINRLISSNYKIHMKDTLLQKIYDILPSNMDCNLDKNLHNITIDSDGTLRLCLRIKGIEVPKLSIKELIDKNGSCTKNYNIVKLTYKQDKLSLCKGCSWTCPIMSQLDQNDVIEH